MTPLIFPLPGNEATAQALVTALDAEMGALETRHFPDGESYVRFLTPVDGRRVILVCTLDRPDARIMPLIFAASGAGELGAKEVGLVVPYLAYMRQDTRFHPGEVVTSTHFAGLLNRCIDWLITIDPHLHRRKSLSEIYDMPTRALQAAPAIAAWIKSSVDKPVLVGPDAESEQWVHAVAALADAPFLVLEKTRHGDRDVEVTVPQVEQWQDHTPVLVDDIISTARTMIETVNHLTGTAMPAPVCIGVHAVFAGDAYQDLQDAGTTRIVTCNTIPHESNGIDLTSLLVDGVREMF